MKRCIRCGFPETYETIEFDEFRVCNICRQHEHKQSKIDWEARKRALDELIAEYRGKYDYDKPHAYVNNEGGKTE